MGCDWSWLSWRSRLCCFNPRTHMGCDYAKFVGDVLEDLFQSTHPHGVRHLMSRIQESDFKFQSTHPHGVRHEAVEYFLFINLVSIHAPTWGATQQSINSTVDLQFQSTHPHGVRLSRDSNCPEPNLFQSTHPHGVRQSALIIMHFFSLFQSTHPHGVRHTAISAYQSRIEFQSTHPHGVRPHARTFLAMVGSFNPRTHMGCD